MLHVDASFKVNINTKVYKDKEQHPADMMRCKTWWKIQNPIKTPTYFHNMSLLGDINLVHWAKCEVLLNLQVAVCRFCFINIFFLIYVAELCFWGFPDILSRSQTTTVCCAGDLSEGRSRKSDVEYCWWFCSTVWCRREILEGSYLFSHQIIIHTSKHFNHVNSLTEKEQSLKKA